MSVYCKRVACTTGKEKYERKEMPSKEKQHGEQYGRKECWLQLYYIGYLGWSWEKWPVISHYD